MTHRAFHLVILLGLFALPTNLGRYVGVRSSARSFSQETITAFHDVSVLPMDSERVLDHQTVIVRGDRIASMGAAAETRIPDGAVIVEGGGKFLIPGLADMHVHLPVDTSAAASQNALTLFVAGGVTTVRVLSGNRRQLTIRDSIAHGRLFGPAMYVAGASIGALADTTADLRRLLTPGEVSRFAEEMKRAGFDFIHITGSMLRPEYERLVTAARKAGIPLTGGVPVDAGLARVIHARQASIENLEGYLEPLERDDSPIHYADPVTRARRLTEYFDPAKIPKIAADLRAAGIANTPTLFINHMGVTQQVPESLAAWPEMRYVAPRTLAFWARQMRRAQDQGGDPQRTFQFIDYRNQLTKGLSDAGALILVGSDSPNAFLVPGYATIYEIHALTVAGLTRYQALRAATRNAAEFMHAEKEFGTIAPGSRADLVLLEKNPLDDIGNLTLRSGVMLRGRWYPIADLEAMLEKIATSFKQ
jgi:cytosine/adenosine deaminase-related metal-dependent hydrolase